MSVKSTLLCVIAVSVAIAAGCTSDGQKAVNPASPTMSPAGVSTVAARPDSQAPQSVPRYVKGTLDGRLTFILSDQAPMGFYSTGEAEGTLSHLGLTQMHIKHTPAPAETPTADGSIVDGTFTMVAANGDKIQGTYRGSCWWISADSLRCEVPFQVTGGTGRFAHATGSLPVTFIETLDDPTYAGAKISWNIVGTVNY